MKSKVFLGIGIVLIVIGAGFYFGKPNPRACQIEIFTYTSFSAGWGSGPKLAQEFQKENQCNISFVDAGSGRQMLSRLKIATESGHPPDLILGLDRFSVLYAKDEFKWKNTLVKFPVVRELSLYAEDDLFVPIDWAPMGFVIKKGSPTLGSFEDLLSKEWAGKISIVDPATSSVGQQMWVWLLKNLTPEQSKMFLDQRHSQTDSWSKSYGFLKTGETQAAFSYLTSVLYHQIEENSEDYQFAQFNLPHPYEVEFAAIPEGAQNSEMAAKFLTFLVSDAGQKILMTSNYMLPAREGVSSGTPFEKIPRIELDSEILNVEDLEKRLNDLPL
jgi:thiamine transport system substrate-binding protein